MLVVSELGKYIEHTVPRSCFLPVFSHHLYRQHRTGQNQSCALRHGRTQSLYCVFFCRPIMRWNKGHNI